MAEALRPGDPRRAGPYELIGRLGTGGMGQVFLGRSPGGRPVAVKVIHRHMLEPDIRARFVREVESARRVNALFTAPVVDADIDGEVPWLATAYVPGPSLRAAVNDHGPLHPSVVRALAAGLAEGLAAIHAADLVHRDLNPSNVLLASDGPRIIDFGISRVLDASALTPVGLEIGTPEFMSPEQAQGLEVGPASDVFSLGSVLTFAATGQGPFRGSMAMALYHKIVDTDPILGDLAGMLRSLVERCLAKDPDDRPTPEQIMAELGPAGLLREWLPVTIASTLTKYDVHGLTSGTTPPANTAEPQSQPTTQPPPALQPGPAVPSQPQAYHPAPFPYQQPTPYRPPPPLPYQRRPNFQPPVTWRPVIASLPAEYRFGRLSLPILLLLGVAAFVLPIESRFVLSVGFVATIVVSRTVALALRIRSKGSHGFGSRILRCLISDLAGAAGLILIYFLVCMLTVHVLLPAIGPGNPGDYQAALNAKGPANPSLTPTQCAYFLHLFLLLPTLVVASVALLRTRGNLERPLVLPRAAKVLNAQPMSLQLAVTGAVAALTIVLVVLNGGLYPGTLPKGAICFIAPATCNAAAQLGTHAR